jgi:pyruvate kinase
MVQRGGTAAIRRELAKQGDKVLVTAGVPFGVRGTTNMMKVESV